MDFLRKVWSFVTSAQFNTTLGAVVALVAPKFSSAIPDAVGQGIATALMVYNAISGYGTYVKAHFSKPAEQPVEAPKAE